jgi:carbon storage regulator CsrA
MLVLQRKIEQAVYIDCACGCRTTVIPVQASDTRVRLAFDAPQRVDILRAELVDPPAARDCPVEAMYRDEAQEGGGGGE